MTKNNWEVLGENIRDIVQNAVDSQDFQKLNQTITSTMTHVVNEMEKSFQKTDDKQTQKKVYQPYTKEENNIHLFARTTRTQVLGIILISIGYGMGAIFILAFLGILMGTLFIAKNIAMTTLLIIFGLLFISFMLLGYKGTNMFSQTKRFQKYIHELSGKAYINIEQLSYGVQKSSQFIKKDLENMISKGWFLEGHLDKEGKCLMVTHEAYNEYLKTIKKPQKEHSYEGLSEDVREVLETGHQYISEIRQCNHHIPGIEISQKISRIELIVQKIFQHIEQHPENIPNIREFMKYYLPTTIKLLKAYKELDQQPIQGENILNSKKEIENTLDTLNSAFEKLLDNLFRDTAWDVSSDVTVLENLLAQDGLTEKSFK